MYVVPSELCQLILVLPIVARPSSLGLAAMWHPSLASRTDQHKMNRVAPAMKVSAASR